MNIGDYVSNIKAPQYGLGKVTSRNKEYLTVYFELLDEEKDFSVVSNPLKKENRPKSDQEINFTNSYTKKKEATIEQLRDAYNYLGSKEGEFWKTNILSTEKLRKNISMLLAKKNQVPETFKNKNSDQTDFHQKRKRFT